MKRCILFSAVILFSFLAMESCRHVLIYKGKSKIVGRTIDYTLADSVLVFGKVVSVLDTLSPMYARIWTNELSKDTFTDIKGVFSLKLPGGTFTINCKQQFGSDEFKETIKDISLSPNEKVEIYFYIGARVE